MTEPLILTHDLIDTWADDPQGPVALHLKQRLLPVEGEGGVIFPPTYKAIGYNIDTLSDGTKVVTIDSVGSQANRMEPIFKREPYSAFVPQIEIAYGEKKKINLLDVGHRLGDAIIRSVKADETGTDEEAFDLKQAAHDAFVSLLDTGDASRIAKLAPTSLVFGVWDSRDTMARLPRIVQSTVRAWNIDKLTRSAQYNPALDYAAIDVFSEKDKQKADGDLKNPLTKRGFVHFPEIGAHGGVTVRGGIERDVTVNLVALRRLEGGDDTSELRRYILGLSLIAATSPLDAFLRQGCLLVPDTTTAPQWTVVDRKGDRLNIELEEPVVREYICKVAVAFGVGENRCVDFDKVCAREDVKMHGKKAKGS